MTHSRAFRARRALNWFPMGLTYAFLYFGRYNLTVSKNALGELMTKEAFGNIFAWGTLVYGVAFLLNGPLVDRIGGRKGVLFAAFGAGVANLLMGFYVRHVLMLDEPGAAPLELTMSLLYSGNMYFQSFAAVAIVKVNSHWFHVTERGGFSGIFGTMISSGIFFAFTVNERILLLTEGAGPGGLDASWWVFFTPAAVLLGMGIFELFVLRDRPGLAGWEDFDTGDATSYESEEEEEKAEAELEKWPFPIRVVLSYARFIGRILANPVLLTVAFIEFCTGVLRNGVMHWFPIYAEEVWALPADHPLVGGSWENWPAILTVFAVAAALFVGAAYNAGRRRGMLVISGAAVGLGPFVFNGGWGGLLFAAGVVGANAAGWVSDLFFQSRRAPAAGGLYFLLTICVVGMIFSLGGTTRTIEWVDEELEDHLRVGDRIVAVEGQTELEGWHDVARAIACVRPKCKGSAHWDPKECKCTVEAEAPPAEAPGVDDGELDLRIERDGEERAVAIPDPMHVQRAGEQRVLEAGPELQLSPFLLGALVVIMSMAVIGSHGLLSGTATMDFGGRRAAATAVGLVDGFVYLGTAVQSVALGHITQNYGWAWWPIFLLPFGIIGSVLALTIWKVRPGQS